MHLKAGAHLCLSPVDCNICIHQSLSGHTDKLTVLTGKARTESHVGKHSGDTKGISTVSTVLETCQSAPDTRRGKPYIHQGTVNAGSWAPKQKKYIHSPAVTDIHWPSDLFPSIKFPEKQSLPQMESLISHCPQIPFSI